MGGDGSEGALASKLDGFGIGGGLIGASISPKLDKPLQLLGMQLGSEADDTVRGGIEDKNVELPCAWSVDQALGRNRDLANRTKLIKVRAFEHVALWEKVRPDLRHRLNEHFHFVFLLVRELSRSLSEQGISYFELADADLLFLFVGYHCYQSDLLQWLLKKAWGSRASQTSPTRAFIMNNFSTVVTKLHWRQLSPSFLQQVYSSCAQLWHHMPEVFQAKCVTDGWKTYKSLEETCKCMRDEEPAQLDRACADLEETLNTTSETVESGPGGSENRALVDEDTLVKHGKNVYAGLSISSRPALDFSTSLEESKIAPSTGDNKATSNFAPFNKPQSEAQGNILKNLGNLLNSLDSMTGDKGNCQPVERRSPSAGAVKSISVNTGGKNATDEVGASPGRVDQAIFGFDENKARKRRPDRNPCNCRKSKCLKLYCECFADMALCDGCYCLDCKNNSTSDPKERQRAIGAILARNPYAFKSKQKSPAGAPNKNIINPCHCKRSRCLKKYCECFVRGEKCTDLCRCLDCQNRPASGDKPESFGATPLFSGATTYSTTPVTISMPSNNKRKSVMSDGSGNKRRCTPNGKVSELSPTIFTLPHLLQPAIASRKLVVTPKPLEPRNAPVSPIARAATLVEQDVREALLSGIQTTEGQLSAQDQQALFKKLVHEKTQNMLSLLCSVATLNKNNTAETI